MLKNPKYVYGSNDRRVLATLHFGEYILKSIWEHDDNVALVCSLLKIPIWLKHKEPKFYPIAGVYSLGIKLLGSSGQNREQDFAIKIINH